MSGKVTKAKSDKYYAHLVLTPEMQWQLNTNLPYMEKPACNACKNLIGENAYYWCRTTKQAYCKECNASPYYTVTCPAEHNPADQPHIHQKIVITEWQEVRE